jgi:transcriptional regulator with XRE-family HTH domain
MMDSVFNLHGLLAVDSEPTFASRLHEVCRKKGLKQIDLARLCHVAQPSVSRWFRGGGVNPATLHFLAEKLGVNPVWLAGR